MNREDISHLLKQSPAVKLLRAHNAPLILAFLWDIFKKDQKITVPGEELIISLATYLELENEDLEEPDFLENARRMIDTWCREDNRYLRKYVNDKGQIVHELTGDLEKVFRWLEDLKPRETVGTESRFSDILRRLEELVSRSTEDPEERIKELKAKRKEIDQEIKEIQASGEVHSFDSWQIKERFEEVSRSSRELLADFKGVEENFKGIVDSIYKEEAENSRSRGDILGFTLDAHQELKSSPQGKTFHSFWRFLVADSGKDSINHLVERVYEILEEKSLSREDDFLKNLKLYLHKAGKRIIDSNHRLGDKINRLLSEDSLLQRKRIKELMGEIKQLILKAKDTPPDDEAFSLIQGDPEVFMPMERPLRFPEEKQDYKNIEEEEEVFSRERLSLLYNQFYVDRKKLEDNISRLLREKPEVSLTELIRACPPEKGLSEIIAYYEIASSSPRGQIIEESNIDVVYSFKEKKRRLKAPEVIFTR